ncbi:MAG: DNA methyltransferase [Chitinophagaceae bacterium]|jgi:DNA modification methylase
MEKNKTVVIYKDPKTLTPSALNLRLYGNPVNNINYQHFKMSVSLFGILTPLIVNNQGDIRSGNLRHQAALDLHLQLVPCIVEEEDERVEELSKSLKNRDGLMEEYRTIIHDLPKQDSPYSMLKRIEILEQIYNLKQGNRSDLNPEVAAAFHERNKIASPTMRGKLKTVRKHLEKSNLSKEKQDEWLRQQPVSSSPKTLCRDAKALTVPKKESSTLKARFKYAIDYINLYNQSSLDLSQIPDKSVQVVGGSPPYFGMRDSQGFEDELGRQNIVDRFATSLVKHYIGCKRILTDDGCIWVNILDPIRRGRHVLSIEKFILSMDEAGFNLCDRLYWAKLSSQPGDGYGSMGNVEHLLKFSLCKEPYTNYEWLNDIHLKEDLKFGQGQRVRLSSFINVRDGIIKTPIASTRRLAEECIKHGFSLENSSTYPIEIPYLFLMTSCKEGSHYMDIFNGTGTTAKAGLIINEAFNKELVYHGFEINPSSVEASIVNIEMDFPQNTSSKSVPLPTNNESAQKAA